MKILTDTEFAQLLDSLGLPQVSVADTYRSHVTDAGKLLHAMEPHETDRLAETAGRCAALALAWNQRVARVLAEERSLDAQTQAPVA